MNLRLRPPMADDADPVLRLSTALYPERPEPAGAWQKADEGAPEYPCWVAEDRADGSLVGYGCARPEGGYPLEFRLWRLHLGVVDHRCREGIGGRLLEQLLADVRERGAGGVRIRIRETRPEALEFLQNRGFAPYQRMLNLVQELAALPGLPDQPLAPAGLGFTTLRQELEQHPDPMAELHDLFCAACVDIPSGESPPMPSLESYAQSVQDPFLLPDCFFLAKEGARYVGMSYAATLPGQPETLGHRFTGVRREYRGQGLARALKSLVTRYAINCGYQRVITSTLEANRPMQAANLALGFTVSYSEIRLHRSL